MTDFLYRLANNTRFNSKGIDRLGNVKGENIILKGNVSLYKLLKELK